MQIRLIVPHNTTVPPIVAYGKAIASIAGGFTATHATGGWIDDNGTLIVEPVVVFDCDVLLSVHEWCQQKMGGQWKALAARICAERRQDCVYLRIDGKVELVKA
jgi:hypothetical protein